MTCMCSLLSSTQDRNHCNAFTPVYMSVLDSRMLSEDVDQYFGEIVLCQWR